MRSARELALLCGFLKNDEWVLTLSWGSKRIDTDGFYPLGTPVSFASYSGADFLYVTAAKRSTAEDFFSAADELPSESVLLSNLFAVSDTVLLHMWFHLRKRGMTVPRNSLTRYTARHLRIRRLVQFIFVGAVYHNALTNCAALLCRACLDEITCVAERYLTLRTGCSRGRTTKAVRP